MIPTWQRFRSKSVRVCGSASAAMLLLQWCASSDAAVAPATINYARSPLSRERMRIAETIIRLQIEQLHCLCESVISLNDTCDAR